MSGRRAFGRRVREGPEDRMDSKESKRSEGSVSDDVASAARDSIQDPLNEGRRGIDSNSVDQKQNNPVRSSFGRRRLDLDSETIATKKLVVITVVLVDALYLAGDALMTGRDICP